MFKQNRPLSRRRFVWSQLAGLAGASVATRSRPLLAVETKPESPIVDTHTHFYDPARPGGVPWPSKQETLLYRTVLPNEFKTLTKPFGVTGTVIIEASPWVEDNQWLLDLAANDPFVLGIVGNLSPGTDSFAAHLARFAKNPLYRGIRIGSGAVKSGLDRSEFIEDLRRLVDADLELDIGGGLETLPLVHQLANRLPQLRVVINHLAGVRIDGKAAPDEWVSDLKAAAKHPNVYMKVSALVESSRVDNGKAPEDTSFYRPVLQATWNTFGEDRLIFGSNWPVSDVGGPYRLIVQIVTDYFGDKGAEAAKKFFAGNAQAAYRWKTR